MRKFFEIFCFFGFREEMSDEVCSTEQIVRWSEVRSTEQCSKLT